MKLSDYKMIEKDDHQGAYQMVLDYGDNIQLSIITGKGAMGGDRGLYEIAVFKDGEFAGVPGIIDIAEDQVRGYLTESEVDAIMFKMFFVTGREPEQV